MSITDTPGEAPDELAPEAPAASRVLMVTAEITPIAKTGGLADAVGALCHALALRGHRPAVVLPRYSHIGTEGCESLFESTAPGLTPARYLVLRKRIGTADLYLVDSPLFSDRRGIYGDRSDSEYADNALRFTLLGHAAYHLASHIGAGIVHGHDWPAGVGLAWCAIRRSAATVLTIHNAAYTGRFARHDLHETGLPARCFHGRPTPGKEEYVAFLEAGLRSAGAVTTVSPGYAREIAPEIARLAGNRTDLPVQGILNGVDYAVWNPEADPYLPARYSISDMSGKQACRRELRRRFGLPDRPSTPVIGMVSRLVEQKGLEELCFPRGGALSRIAGLETQIVILGAGSERYERELEAISRERPNLSVRIGFDEELAHLIEAGSDFFLMPSRFEPCGLNQLYSLRYGTPPIVHATGGLADTVRDAGIDGRDGTGFVYQLQTPAAIYRTACRAVRIYRNRPDAHRRIMVRGMAERFSWDRTAAEYERIYRAVLTSSRSRRR